MLPTTTSVFVVDLRCMACGREHEIIVGSRVEFLSLPERCAVCGGSVLAVSSTSRVVRTEGPLDWNEGRPPRGRPPRRPVLSEND